MRMLFVILPLIFALEAHANFDKFTVQNLDLDYVAPYGKGTVDRVGIGLSFTDPKNYGIEFNRTADAFELTSPYVDFSWKYPLRFFYETERITARKTSAGLGTKVHFIESEYFMLNPKGRGEYKAYKVKGLCDGKVRGSFEERLLEDCRKKMELTIEKIDVPEDFILYKISEGLPSLDVKESEIPADNVVLKINEGELYLQVYIKFLLRAGLRTWGHLQYENENEIMAIRVDKIKFGYLPVTNIVMKILKDNIKNPDVTIDPPWIRINIGDLHAVR